MNKGWILKTLLLISLLGFGASLKPSQAEEIAREQYVFLSHNGEWSDRLLQLNFIDPQTADIASSLILPQGIFVYDVSTSPNREWVAFIPEDTFREDPLLLYHIPSGDMRVIPIGLGFRGGDQYRYYGNFSILAWSADSQYVAYLSRHEEGQYDVYLYAIEEERSHKLTNDPIIETNLTWSQEGLLLALASAECNPTVMMGGCAPQIEIFDLSNQLQITSIAVPASNFSLFMDGICDLRFAPDDRYISFVSFCSGDPYSSNKELFIIDLLAEKTIFQTYFTETAIPLINAPPGDLGWRFGVYSPFWYDANTLLLGTTIGVDVGGVREAQTFVYRLDYNYSVEAVFPMMGREWALNPIDNRLAFLATDDYYEINQASIYLANFDGDSIQILSTHPAGCFLSWSSDGQTLAYTEHGEVFSGCYKPVTGIHFIDVQGQRFYDLSTFNESVFPIGWIEKTD